MQSPRSRFSGRARSLRTSAILVILLGVTLLLPPVFFQTSAQASRAGRTLYVRCGKLIFDADKAPIENAAVIIVDGKVTAVGRELAAPAGAEQLDLSAYTVLPGFIDAHTHIWTGPRSDRPSDPLSGIRAAKAARYALQSGVSAMRILGCNNFVDVALHDAIEEGTIQGPHIIAAGHALSIPAGHGDSLTFPANLPLEEYYTPLHGFISSPADAEKAVHLQVKYGARVIKILASGGVGSPLDSPTSEQLSPEEMRVIVEQAHMTNIKVAAHDENLKTILDALHAGVDSIEHGSELNAEAIDFMKQHRVYLVPTVYIVDNILQNGEKEHLPGYMVRKARELAEKHFASFKLATAAGVLIAAGSDMSYEPGRGTVLDEMVTEVKYGMTARQALVSATSRGAALLGIDNLGTIASGMEGDLVAVEGDPLADISAVHRIKVVVHKGEIVSDQSRKRHE
jgi:imidazolonepropionase-like amidohydrolase